jgi:hypothetical protein
VWRNCRLRLAEAAVLRQGLNGTLHRNSNTATVALVHLDGSARSEGVADAIRSTATDTKQEGGSAPRCCGSRICGGTRSRSNTFGKKPSGASPAGPFGDA